MAHHIYNTRIVAKLQKLGFNAAPIKHYFYSYTVCDAHLVRDYDDLEEYYCPCPLFRKCGELHGKIRCWRMIRPAGMSYRTANKIIRKIMHGGETS